MAICDINGNKILAESKQTNQVLIASSTADNDIKAMADYICTGTNDELVIQQAINLLAGMGGGKILLSKGTFYIGSFPNTDSADDSVALMLPISVSSSYSIRIVGAARSWGSYKNAEYNEGTRLEIKEADYEALSSSAKYTLIRSGYINNYLSQASVTPSLYIEDLAILIPSNQRKITAIDCRYMNNAKVENVRIAAMKNGYDDYTSGGYPKVAVEDCVGIRFMSGSNSGNHQNFYNVGALGFYEGFKIGAEHVVAINLYALYCVYGYTFGNYGWYGNFNHDITLINCCDEKNVNLPLFNDCGRKTGYSATSTGGPQAISLIDFNMERYESGGCPGGVIGDYAKETTPGKFRGTIEFTMMTSLSSNAVDKPFWTDGHGKNFVTRNRAHALSGSSTVRRGYKPTYLQQFYDTTVGKMLWCVDTATPTWKDAQGNTVA